VDDALVIQTAQNVDLAFSPAGLGERIGAWVVDVLLAIAYYVVLAWLGADALSTAAGVLLSLPPLLYHLACEVLFEGQTAGKRLLQIQVARLDGAAPTLGQYLLRWLFRFLDVSVSLGLVAVVAIATTRRSQRLGDVVAGTTVVRRKRRVRLHEVRYPAREAAYEPAFPDAARLADADVRTLRAVLVRVHREPKSASAHRLAIRAKEAVERRLGLPRVAMPTVEFIETVVADYTAIHDRLTEPT
jgi:uncharacterized RDD family membrane protein YckC